MDNSVSYDAAELGTANMVDDGSGSSLIPRDTDDHERNLRRHREAPGVRSSRLTKVRERGKDYCTAARRIIYQHLVLKEQDNLEREGKENREIDI